MSFDVDLFHLHFHQTVRTCLSVFGTFPMEQSFFVHPLQPASEENF